jgi:hypothetical protein
MSRLLHISKEERLEVGEDQDIALIRTRGRPHQETLERVRLMIVQDLPSCAVREQLAYQTWNSLQVLGKSRHEPNEATRKREGFAEA